MISVIRHILMVAYTILCIVISMILMVLLFNKKLPLVMARAVWAPGILLICRMSYTATGQNNIKKNTPYIYMVNHISHLDIPIAVAAIPDNIHFIGKKSLSKIPFLGWYMRINGMIFIDRSDRAKSLQSLQQAGELIRKGKSVILFPEGTRSKNGELSEFKKGGFHIALNAKVDIIPVNIQGTQKSWKPGSSKVKGGAKVRVKIGEPIQTTNHNMNTLNEFVKEVREKVGELA